MQTVMTQCELWTDNAEFEETIPNTSVYDFTPEQSLSMIAETPAAYDENKSYNSAEQ